MLFKYGTGYLSSRGYGQIVEQYACQYLRSRGLRLLARNFVCRCGEIDLIMQDKESCVVFTEVRFRASRQFGTALESVDAHKIERIRKASSIFLLQQRELQNAATRFDVIAYNHKPTRQFNKPIWIRNAFS